MNVLEKKTEKAQRNWKKTKSTKITLPRQILDARKSETIVCKKSICTLHQTI